MGVVVAGGVAQHCSGMLSSKAVVPVKDVVDDVVVVVVLDAVLDSALVVAGMPHRCK